MRLAAVACAYLLLAAVWVYGVAESDRFQGHDVSLVALLAVVAGVHLAVGLLAASCWALVLPVLATVMAVPAGYPDVSVGEPLPIWFGFLLMLPIAIPAIAAGVLATELRASHRRRLRSS